MRVMSFDPHVVEKSKSHIDFPLRSVSKTRPDIDVRPSGRRKIDESHRISAEERLKNEARHRTHASRSSKTGPPGPTKEKT
jgi:hypothetical protein